MENSLKEKDSTMTRFTFYKLYFKGPLHIGSKPTGQLSGIENLIHSDTLASALASALALTGQLKDAEAIKNFLEGLTISSAFPFVDIKSNSEAKKKYYYFLPAPKGFVLSKDPDHRKIAKKVKWYDCASWQKILQGEKLDFKEEHISGAHYVGGAKAKEIVGGITKKEERMRVQIPRNEGADAIPFSSEELYFKNDDKKKAGLFFIVPDTVDTDKLEFALDTLSDLGIGADRTIGYGHFEWKKIEGMPFLQEDFDSDYYMSLGTYAPVSKEELEDFDPYKYDLLLRSGWITREGLLNVRRNSLYMFGEGSIFKTKNNNAKILYKGEVKNVTPGEPKEATTYRSGKTLFVKIKIEENGK